MVDARVCLDKSMELIDCLQPKPHQAPEKSQLLRGLGIPNVEQCPPDALLYYIPPRPDHYHSDEQHRSHGYAHNYREEYGDKWDKEHHEDSSEEHDE